MIESHRIVDPPIKKEKNEKEKKEKKEWASGLYIRGGLSLNYIGCDSDWHDEYAPGFHAGYYFAVGGQFRLGKGFYYNPEIGLGTRGRTSHYYDDDESDGFLAHNVKLMPAGFGYSIPLSRDLQLDVHAGIGCSFDHSVSYDDYYYDADRCYYDDGEMFDMYFKGGIGLYYKQFNFDFSFQPGFFEIANSECNKSFNLMLTVGYKFPVTVNKKK